MRGSGQHPMVPRRRGADAEAMMVLHPRTTGRDRSAAPADGRRARFRRAADRLAAAPDRAARVEQLKAEIAAGTYRPDPGAIAAAVVERLAAAPQRQCS
jgi:anti-sigma-28 factor FlgM